MSKLYSVMIISGFLGLLVFSVVPPFVGHLQPSAREVTTSAAVPAPAQGDGERQRVLWYRDPARTALIGGISGAVVGAIATTCAAFMTGLIHVRVRKITNEHELQLRELVRQHERQKISIQKQLEVCGSFAEQIVKFNLIIHDKSSVGVFDGLIEVIATFERSYPFLDKQTAKTFDELISIPFKNEEFVSLYQEKGGKALYHEVLQRLTQHVLPALRAFFDSIK